MDWKILWQIFDGKILVEKLVGKFGGQYLHKCAA